MKDWRSAFTTATIATANTISCRRTYLEINRRQPRQVRHEAASPYTIHTAVLQKPSHIDANINSAIMAMLDIVQPKNDNTDEDATNFDVLPPEKYISKTDQLFQCHVNQMSLLWNGLTTNH